MELKPISVYGILPLTPEQILLQQHRLFMYLEALIRAERLNPESDYEGIRKIELLKRISMSDTTVVQRVSLLLLLEGNEPNEPNEEEEEEENDETAEDDE
jgi:hypothetical protein